MDFVSLVHPFLEAEQKVTVLWLDDSYCLLSFPTPATCTRVLEAWHEAQTGQTAQTAQEEERLAMKKVVLERFDAFERLCGMNVAKKEESRKREREESVVFENKRLRIVKIKRPESEKKWCCVLWRVCTNRRVHYTQQ